MESYSKLCYLHYFHFLSAFTHIIFKSYSNMKHDLYHTLYFGYGVMIKITYLNFVEFRRRLLTHHCTRPARNWLIKFNWFSGVQRRLGKNS